MGSVLHVERCGFNSFIRLRGRSMERYSIRLASRRDVSEILRLIHLVAEREKSEVDISDRGSMNLRRCVRGSSLFPIVQIWRKMASGEENRGFNV